MACDSPFFGRNKGNWVPFPCGKCPSCRKRRTDEWVFRVMQEEKVSLSSYFITLTYDTDHVPISPNGLMTLDPDHFTKYMKRLRKLQEPGVYAPIKYYMCGEYGSTNHRPHFHACVFNVLDEYSLFKAWHLDGVPFGTVHVGTVTGNSIAYTVGYMDKRDWFPWGNHDDRVSEYSRMSQRLGEVYAHNSSVQAFHKADLSRTYCVKDNGDKIAMPRYYKDRIFDDDERAAQGVFVELAVGEQNSILHRHWLNNFSHRQTFGEYLHALRESKLSNLSLKTRTL